MSHTTFADGALIVAKLGSGTVVGSIVGRRRLGPGVGVGAGVAVVGAGVAVAVGVGEAADGDEHPMSATAISAAARTLRTTAADR
jgi:hypothetical protein